MRALFALVILAGWLACGLLALAAIRHPRSRGERVVGWVGGLALIATIVLGALG